MFLKDLLSPKKVKQSERDIHYFYSAKCLKMVLLGPKQAEILGVGGSFPPFF